MKGIFRLLGILFALITILLGISLLAKDAKTEDHTIRSWSIIVMSGALIFNGGYYYLKDRNKQGIVMTSVGIVILIMALSVFPF